MTQNAENKLLLMLVAIVVIVAGVSVYMAGEQSKKIARPVTRTPIVATTVGNVQKQTQVQSIQVSENNPTSEVMIEPVPESDELDTVEIPNAGAGTNDIAQDAPIEEAPQPDPLRSHKARLQEALENIEGEFDPKAELVTVKGRAFDFETGLPVTDVAFVGHDYPEVITPDENGNFELQLLPNSTNTGLVSFEARNDYAEYSTLNENGVQPVNLATINSEVTPSFSLGFFKQRNVTVKVLSEGSLEPAEGVEVTVFQPTKTDESEMITKVTDTRGSFEIPLIPLKNYSFLTSHGGVSKSQSLILSSALTDDTFYIYVPETATINGIVLRPDREPAVGITITAVQDSEESAGKFMTETDGNGDFRFPPLPAGNYEVWAEVPQNYAYVAPEEVKRVTVTSKRPETNIVFTLEEGDYVSGIVVTQDKQPIEGVTISRNGDPLNPDNILTGPDGTFQVTGIKKGSSLPGLYFLHQDYETEVRSEVNLLDGYQEIVLTKINLVKLQVVWADDGSPVNYYAYRLLESGWNDFEATTGKAATNVFTEDGITNLDRLENGTYRVEAILLDPTTGEMTTIRDAQSFTLEEGGQELTVKIELIGGHRVQGQLIFSGDGDPVPYTDVRFVPPSDGFMNINRPLSEADQAFANLRATSDAQGYFEFEGIPPGRFTLEVESPALIQDIPYDFEVVAETPPEFITIELHRGGVISGLAKGLNGESLRDAFISQAYHSANLDSWERDYTTTDENGYYEFRKVTKGTHFLDFRHDETGLTRSDQIDVELGENFQHDFDFSDGIQVSGTITYNGEVSRETLMVQFIRTDTVKSPWVQVGRDGSYSVRLMPGDYKLRANGLAGESDIIPLNASQTKDIDIVSVTADVILLFPDGAEFVPGKLVIAPEILAGRYQYIRRNMDQETRHLTDFIEGKYRATFTSNDGEWSGDTEFVDLYGGGENVFLIEVEQAPRTLKIDTWSPNEIGVNFQRERVNVSQHLKGPGQLIVYFEYEKGRHALKIQNAAIYQNGSLVSIDSHEGWAGFDVIGTRYYLNLPRYDPEAIYEIDYVVKGDGGSDSTGSVYLDIR